MCVFLQVEIMKKQMILGCALLLSVACVSAAEAEAELKAGNSGVKAEINADTDKDLKAESRISTDTRVEAEAQSKPNGFKGTDIIGLEVRNMQNQKLGEISDFIVDLSANRTVYAVVAAGGFLGIGGKQLAVPPGAFVVTNRDDMVLWDANKELITSAPAFDRHNWIAMADADFGRQVYSHYDQSPYWNAQINEAAGAEPRRQTNGVVVNSRTTTNRLNNPPPGPGWEPAYRPQGESDIEAARAQGRPILGKVIRGSELIGMPVLNKERTKLGDIKDVMVAMPSGKVQYAVLGSGGVLGVGDKLVAIPLNDFTLSEDGEALLLYVAPETIKNAKGLLRTNWPDSADPNWRASVETEVDNDPAGAKVEVKTDHDLDDKLDFDLRKNDGPEAKIEVKKD